MIRLIVGICPEDRVTERLPFLALASGFMAQRKILLVDDDPVYLTLGVEELESHGYAVCEAENGAEALEKLRDEAFDIVISDLEMPILTGLGLLEAIRADSREQVAALPFIMITGRGDIESVGRAFESGATSFVQKPVNWLTVVHHVEFVLRASEQAAALRTARDQAKKALDSKNAVLMALRHELRSPLHVIQGFSDLLSHKLRDRLDEQAQMEFSFIHDGVDDMTDKIDKLFLYADIINGETDFRMTETSLASVIKVAVARVKRSAEASDTDITVTYGPGCEEMTLIADEKTLSTALGHILDNAVKFGPHGAPVDVTISAVQGMPSITIRDRGDGFDPERTDTYLAGFGQSDDGLTRTSSGIGLGLTLANHLTVAHRGVLHLSNAPDGGGVVTITFDPPEEERQPEPLAQAG